MTVIYGGLAGSGSYWKTQLNYTTSNSDTTTTVNVSVGVYIQTKIPSSVASKWNKTHDTGWAKVGGTERCSYSEGNGLGTITNINAGSNFYIKSGSASYTRRCTDYTTTVQGQNYHSGSGGSKPLVGTSTTSAPSVTIPHRTLYTITYNANGGTLGANTVSVCSNCGANHKSFGYNATLSSVIPTRAGYRFVCWNTSADGTGTSYNAGATYSANANVTLYAQWECLIKLKNSGNWIDAVSSVKVNGAWTDVNDIYIKNSGTWIQL